MQMRNFSSVQGAVRPGRRERSSQIAAAIAGLLIAPVVLIEAPAAQGATGIDGYASCLGGDTKPPPPGVSADVWFPSVHVIQTDLDSGDSPEQVTAILIGMGVKPTDAAMRVQCFVANQPRGEGH